MTYLSKITPAVVVLVLISAACGTEAAQSDRASSTDSDDVPANSLDDDWLLVAASVDGKALTLPPDYDVTLTIAGTQIGGRAACNGYGGIVAIDGEAFSVSEISMTEMGCEPPIMELESAYAGALLRVSTASRSGQTLRLAGAGVDLEFDVIEPVATAELSGTVWVLDTIIQGDAASSTLSSADDATLQLDPDGRFTGSTGCRTISGEYVISGGTVQFTSWGAQGECTADLVSQDGDVISVLEGPFKVEIDGDRLTVTAPGSEALSYHARG